jgi:hypothetical protein
VYPVGERARSSRKLAVELVDLTRDGNTTQGVLGDLARAPAVADFVTLTAGATCSAASTPSYRR